MYLHAVAQMSHGDLAEGCYEISRNNLLFRLPCINVTLIS